MRLEKVLSGPSFSRILAETLASSTNEALERLTKPRVDVIGFGYGEAVGIG
jgi:hypothetical protein